VTAAARSDLVPTTDRRMRDDLRHYCAKLVKIQDKSGKRVPFRWNEAQARLHARIEKQLDARGLVRALVLKARQTGVSTYFGARFYRKTSLWQGQHTYILTHEDKATQQLFGMAKFIHDNMPTAYKPATGASNEHELSFPSLGANYRVGTARNVEGSGRALTLQNFHGSEVPFWRQAHAHFAAVLQAVPLIDGTEVALEGTSAGPQGTFYEQWALAEKGLSDFITIFLPWFIEPGYAREVDTSFDPSIEEIKYQQLYKLTDDQLCWAHYKNIELGGSPGDIGSEFKREYPAIAAEAFQAGSANSLIADEYVLAARRFKAGKQDGLPRTLGVDVARSNKDEKDKSGKILQRDATRLIDRQGRKMGQIDEEYYSDDATFIAAKVMKHLRDKPDIRKAYIDASEGMGAAVVSIVKSNGFEKRVAGINFGQDAQEPDLYPNRRCEMWGRMRDWFKDPGGAEIPDSDVAQRHLTAPRYQHDPNGRLVLEKKEKIKGRTGFSPDWGDAAALNFAEILAVEIPDERPKWMKDAEVDDDSGSDFMTA